MFSPLNLTVLEGPVASGKTRQLVTAVVGWLQSGRVASQHVLVLASNHARQQQFQQQLLANCGHTALGLGEMPVYTYSGFVRQMLLAGWPHVEALLGAVSTHTVGKGPVGVTPKILPTLCGFEVTEQLLRHRLAWVRLHQPEAFQGFPGDDSSLVKQIFRRHRLRAECGISRGQLAERDAMLAMAYAAPVHDTETWLDATTARLRMLDPARQLMLFDTLLAKVPAFAQQVRQRCQYLVVDDVDETHPAQQRFVAWVMGNVEESPNPNMPAQNSPKKVLMAGNTRGGSRRGYLNAYPQGWQAILSAYPQSVQRLEAAPAQAQRQKAMLQGWGVVSLENHQPKDEHPKQIPVPGLARVAIHPTRWDMLTAAVGQLAQWQQQGVAYGQMAIVLPRLDDLTTYALGHAAQKAGIPIQRMSGGATPMTDSLARGLLTALQVLYRPEWRIPLSATEWQWLWFTLFPQTLPYRQAVVSLLAPLSGVLAQHPQPMPPWPLVQAQWSSAIQQALPDDVVATMAECYTGLAQVFQSCHGLTVVQSVYRLWTELFTAQVWPRQSVPAVEQLFKSLHHTMELQQRLYAMESMANVPTSEELAQRDAHLDAQQHTQWVRQWLLQVKQGVVAETSSVPAMEDGHAVFVATPQKLLDMDVRRSHVIWLDVTSVEWERSDDAPLYHAWVQGAQSPEELTQAMNASAQQLRWQRAAHVTTALLGGHIQAIIPMASRLDDSGQDAPDIPSSRLAIVLQQLATGDNASPTQGTMERAVLRDDQQAVLSYQGGTMAIAAVPGAGKTFVNVELICELVSRGMPAGQILVLTFMDSAARTMQGRLQKKLNSTELPTVSTIHGLAYRLLTENEHFRRFPELGEELTVMDDFDQQQRLSRIADAVFQQHLRDSSLKPRAFYKLAQRCITDAKYYGLTPDAVAQVLTDPETGHLDARYRWCVEVFRQYTAQCQAAGEVDFTDLIVLATRLLAEQDDVRAAYQQQFRIIIEDEAQDSSLLLQRFIGLLGGESPNLIRTGDTNQSITTTFSAADPSVFREFGHVADKKVTMYKSGRCAKEVMALANQWQRFCIHHPTLHQAFVPVDMKPVPGMNPSLLFPMQAHTFASDTDEQQHWMSAISHWRQQYPTASIAVLVNTNQEAVTYAGALQKVGIPAISLSETYQSHPVFSVILALLRVVVQPASMDAQQQLVAALTDAGVLFQPPFVDEVTWQPALDAELAWLNQHLLLGVPLASIPHVVVQRLAYDVQEFCQLAASDDLPTLVATMACRYFTDTMDRSNGLLCALEARRFLMRRGDMLGEQAGYKLPIELLLAHFEQLYRGHKMRRSFGDALELAPEAVVQVMTLHKSKGQEFDIVVMPSLIDGLWERDALSAEEELSVRLRQSVTLPVGAGNDEATTAEWMQQFIQQQKDERARLMYVGITRAKKALCCSTVQQVQVFGRPKSATPSAFYGFVANALNGQAALPSATAGQLAQLLPGDDPAAEALTAEGPAEEVSV